MQLFTQQFIREGKSMGRVTHKEFAVNKATGCRIGKCGPKTEWGTFG